MLIFKEFQHKFTTFITFYLTIDNVSNWILSIFTLLSMRLLVAEVQFLWKEHHDSQVLGKANQILIHPLLHLQLFRRSPENINADDVYGKMRSRIKP